MNFQPKGIIPPIVTPLDEHEKLNETALRQICQHLMAQGVHGLFPVGTTGEFYGLNTSETRRIWEIVIEEAAGRVPVYAGCNHITTRGVVELVKMAEQVGADAVSVLTPMFISQTQDEIYEYYHTIAQNTSLPIIVYNNRPKTNITVTPETVARLAEIPNIIGVKDSTGDMTNTEEYLRLTRHLPDFCVLVGRDTMIYAGLCYGATGAISSCANVAPAIAVEIYEKFLSGDHEGAREAQFKLAPLRIASDMATFPAMIKEGLEMQGFAVGKCMKPIQEITPQQRETLRSLLLEMGLVQ